MLLGIRPLFFHLPYLSLQCWWTRGAPAARFFFFCNSPASGVSFTTFQQFDQTKGSDGPVLVL
jgi:hypothetical protein